MVEVVLASTPMESFSIFVEDDGLGEMGLPPLFLAEEATVDDKTYFLESVTGVERAQQGIYCRQDDDE